jgi:hypothetical protein
MSVPHELGLLFQLLQENDNAEEASAVQRLDLSELAALGAGAVADKVKGEVGLFMTYSCSSFVLKGDVASPPAGMSVGMPFLLARRGPLVGVTLPIYFDHGSVW